jgi:uncharacterized protein YlbG (UPF0298 family)
MVHFLRPSSRNRDKASCNDIVYIISTYNKLSKDLRLWCYIEHSSMHSSFFQNYCRENSYEQFNTYSYILKSDLGHLLGMG